MFGRITTQMTASMTLNDLQQSLNRLDTTQQQLSSGKKINQPSDDPYGTSQAMSLNGQLSSLNDYTNNITDGTAWTQQATTSLGDIDSMVQRVRELVVQASNGTYSQSDLNASASEVNQLIDAIKQEANASYNGQYIFSGTSTGTAPYQTGVDRHLPGRHRERQPPDRPQHDAVGQHQHLDAARQRPGKRRRWAARHAAHDRVGHAVR